MQLPIRKAPRGRRGALIVQTERLPNRIDSAHRPLCQDEVVVGPGETVPSLVRPAKRQHEARVQPGEHLASHVPSTADDPAVHLREHRLGHARRTPPAGLIGMPVPLGAAAAAADTAA